MGCNSPKNTVKGINDTIKYVFLTYTGSQLKTIHALKKAWMMTYMYHCVEKKEQKYAQVLSFKAKWKCDSYKEIHKWKNTQKHCNLWIDMISPVTTFSKKKCNTYTCSWHHDIVNIE